MSTVSTSASAPWSGGVRGNIGARLRGSGALKWYGGAAFGLVYQVIELWGVWSSNGSLGEKIFATALLLVVYGLFLVIPPLVWPMPVRVRVIAVLAFWAFTFVLFPVVGITTVWVWSLLVVMVSFVWLPRVPALVLVLSIVAVQVIVVALAGWPVEVAYAPFITFAVGFSMVFYAQLIMQNQQLQDAHAEIARLAVSEERARLARDLHDSLGHSLTVVAVKSELAGKLVDRDSVKVKSELADIERLARDGLSDLRASVAGYRDVDLASELASARIALIASGVDAHLPEDVGIVRPEFRALFGWVVREGVTNVIRHAEASNCWIDLGPRRVLIRDDGAGSAPGSPGNGLRGLRERADAAGATVRSGAAADGGFELEVTA